MRTVAIINQKGGCGKTTTAINLAGAFASRGADTLLVDLDPQSHCAAGLAIPESRVEMDIADAMLLERGQRIEDDKLLWRVSRGFDLIPSRTRLAGLEARDGGLSDAPDRELRLRHVLDRYRDRYAACFIDCSPAIGLLTYNAMAAADTVLVPVETSYFSLKGAANQMSSVRALARRVGGTIRVWVAPTIHEATNTHANDLLGELRERYGQQVAPVTIRRDNAVREAASFGQTVLQYSPGSEGARDYAELAAWLAGVMGVEFAVEAPTREDPRSGAASSPSVRVRTGGVGADALAKRLAAARSGSGGAGPSTPVVAAADADAPTGSVAAIETGATSGTPVASTTESGLGEPLRAEVERGLSRAEDLVRRASAIARRAEGQGAAVHLDTSAGDRGAEGAREPAVVSPSTRRLVGATVTSSGVLFCQPIELGDRIAVAGDFNGWSSESHVLLRNSTTGVHELCVPLGTGKHSYRLVIDGRWTHDPNNPAREPNPFGEQNSVIEVVGATHA